MALLGYFGATGKTKSSTRLIRRGESIIIGTSAPRISTSTPKVFLPKEEIEYEEESDPFDSIIIGSVAPSVQKVIIDEEVKGWLRTGGPCVGG